VERELSISLFIFSLLFLAAKSIFFPCAYY